MVGIMQLLHNVMNCRFDKWFEVNHELVMAENCSESELMMIAMQKYRQLVKVILVSCRLTVYTVINA